MVDYNIGIPQQQLFQAPDVMQNAMRMQQMQTQGAQVESANQLRAMQTRGLAQDQQLTALKMQAARQAMTDAAATRAEAAKAQARAAADQNALFGAIQGSVVGDAGPQFPDLRVAANRLAAIGKLGPAATALGAAEAFGKADKANADLDKINIDNLDKELLVFKTMAPSVRTPEDAAMFTGAMAAHPRIGKLILQMGTREELMEKARRDFAADPERWTAANVGLSAPQVVDLLKQKQTTVERAGSTVQQTEDAFGRVIGEKFVDTAEAKEARRLEGLRGTKRAEAGVKKDIENEDKVENINNINSELKSALKPGGLLSQVTSGGLAADFDRVAGYFNVSTLGADATAALKPIAALAVQAVPRFEGPQSNADVASYKEAAGDLANANLPVSQRIAAAKTIVRLNEKRVDQINAKSGGQSGAGAAQPKVVNFGDLK